MEDANIDLMISFQGSALNMKVVDKKGIQREEKSKRLERKLRRRVVEGNEGLKRRNVLEDQRLSLDQNHLQCFL